MPLLTKISEIEVNSLRIPVLNLNYNMIQSEVWSNRAMYPMGARIKPAPGAIYTNASFSVEIGGSGTPGTPPWWGVLLGMCGCQQAISSGTSVTYTIEDDGLKSDVTPQDLGIFIGDSYKVVIDDAVGTVRMTFNANEPGIMHYSFAGEYIEPTSASSAATRAANADPPICKGLSASIDGTTLVVRGIEIDFAGVIHSPRNNIAGTNGVSDATLVDIHPMIRATFELPMPSSKNVMNLFSTNSRIEFSIPLGSTSGNITTITIHGYMSAAPSIEDDNGIAVVNIECEMSWLAADTPFTMVCT